MFKFENSVVIKQPIEKVFQFATNIRNNGKWQTGILESALTNKPDMGEGASYRCVNEFMGLNIETQGVITRYDPYTTCSYHITSGPVRGESSFMFECLGKKTLMTTTGHADLSFFKVGKSLVARKLRKQLKKDMRTLRAVMEASE